MKGLPPKILLVVVLIATGFFWDESRLHGSTSETKAVPGPVSSSAPDVARGGIQERATTPEVLMPVPAARTDARNNQLIESKFLVAGSLDSGAVVKALDDKNFASTVSLLGAASQQDPVLVARNQDMRRKLADALEQVDDDAVLKEFACSRSLCVAEVRAEAGKQSIDYAGFLTDELDREKTAIYTQVSSNEQVGRMTAFRTFFSMGPAIRSIRAPSQ